MKIASNTYASVSTRLGLNADARWINITGTFIYSGLRAAAGSTIWGLSAEGLLNYGRIVSNPDTDTLWKQNMKSNPYSGFVVGSPCFSCWQWIYGKK